MSNEYAGNLFMKIYSVFVGTTDILLQPEIYAAVIAQLKQVRISFWPFINPITDEYNDFSLKYQYKVRHVGHKNKRSDHQKYVQSRHD